MNKVLIRVYGGVVQDVLVDDANIEVTLDEGDNQEVAIFPVSLVSTARIEGAIKDAKADYQQEINYQNRLTIEPVHGKIWVCQHGIYDEDSVLAGQPYRQLMRCYPTVDDALRDYPDAKVEEDETYVPRAEAPKEPPAWFDPLDAGEAWSEDDY